MAPRIVTQQEVMERIKGIYEKLEALEVAMNTRFEKLKKIVIDYLNLGSEFAKGSLITALKQV